MLTSGDGIYSRWWQSLGSITESQITSVLTADNLDRHLHEYHVYGPQTPYISLAAGTVLRDPAFFTNLVYDGVDTALTFATDNGTRPGVLFYCWTIVALHAAVSARFVSEPVRDLLIYRGWSPYHDEGEIAAKIHIPAQQICRVEWWDPGVSMMAPCASWDNPEYMLPDPLLNERHLVRAGI